MQIDDQIQALTARLNQLETEIAVLKSRSDNHETQMEKIEASITALHAIRDDISQLRTDIAVQNTTQKTTIKTLVWVSGAIFTALGTVITNWTTIKGLIQ